MRPRLLDVFCGEGGAAMGYHRAGFDVFGVDTSAKRLERYPFPSHRGDAIQYILDHGHEYDLIHGSPTCTGYSRGTAAIPDRLARYDRLIGATREAMQMVGARYVIENVEDAKRELRNPIMLCGRQFNLTATDEDGSPLVMDRHRVFESNLFLLAPPHPKHRKDVQVARRDKDEARNIRKGGYVPKSVDVQRDLLGTPWMSEKGCQLSIPPVYAQFIGEQLLAHLESESAA
jgi:DNA (cytosine-5)-methyltransferase 1